MAPQVEGAPPRCCTIARPAVLPSVRAGGVPLSPCSALGLRAAEGPGRDEPFFALALLGKGVGEADTI